MKDPAFLFYSSDFLSGVQDLTMEERGQYITLLCIQHQKGHLTEKMIRLSCGNATEDVLAKFEQDENGNFFSKRLEIEIQKRREHSEKQRQRAIDGWEKRKKETQATASPTANATALPLENGNEGESKDVIEDKDESFEIFWNLYDKKIDRKKCETAWKRVKKSLHDTIYSHVKLYVASTPDVRYRKNPLSYIHANAWENDIITPFDGQTTPLTEELRPMDYTKGFGDV